MIWPAVRIKVDRLLSTAVWKRIPPSFCLHSLYCMPFSFQLEKKRRCVGLLNADKQTDPDGKTKTDVQA